MIDILTRRMKAITKLIQKLGIKTWLTDLFQKVDEDMVLGTKGRPLKTTWLGRENMAR